MKYRIFSKNNYFILINENNTYCEEVMGFVRVSKIKETDTNYRIEFLRDKERTQIYDVAFADILTEAGVPYTSVAEWEDWYTSNSGQIGSDSGIAVNTTILRVSNTNTISGAYSISFANIGGADGTVNGIVLKPGETISFSTEKIPLDDFTYNSTNTEFLITYLS